jgi:hypothetical protein
LRNVLQATTNENAQSFLVHLNDNNPSVLARNILILKILSDTSFNPDKEEDLSFLWDIWYNAELSEVTKKRFLIVLKDILDGRLPENVCVPDTSQLECLKEVWSSWLAICSKEEPELISLMQKIKKDRYGTLNQLNCQLVSCDFLFTDPHLSVKSSTLGLEDYVSWHD